MTTKRKRGSQTAVADDTPTASIPPVESLMAQLDLFNPLPKEQRIPLLLLLLEECGGNILRCWEAGWIGLDERAIEELRKQREFGAEIRKRLLAEMTLDYEEVKSLWIVRPSGKPPQRHEEFWRCRGVWAEARLEDGKTTWVVTPDGEFLLSKEDKVFVLNYAPEGKREAHFQDTHFEGLSEAVLFTRGLIERGELHPMEDE